MPAASRVAGAAKLIHPVRGPIVSGPLADDSSTRFTSVLAPRVGASKN